MSEHSLWERIRNNIGHRGHFTRLEFNPEAGVPDVDFCIKGVEGKIELKYTGAAPARADTPVFKHGGLRDPQVIWIYTRWRHGGNVFVLPQIGDELLLVPGSEARRFNALTLHALRKASTWSNRGAMTPAIWGDLTAALIGVAR